MAAGCGGEASAAVEPLQRVLAQGLQQPVTDLPAGLAGAPGTPGAGGCDHDQGLVDEVAEEVHHRPRLDPLAAADRLGGLQAEVAGEDAEPAEQRPLLPRGGARSSSPPARGASGGAGRRAGAAGQQAEAVAQPGGELLGPQHPHARGRRARGPAAGRPAGRRSRPPRPPFWSLSANAGTVAPARSTKRRTASYPRSSSGDHDPAPRGDGEGRDGPHRLAHEVERLPAGGQDGEPRAVPEERLRHPRAGVDQVLAVVQHQEQPARAQRLVHGLQEGRPASSRTPRAVAIPYGTRAASASGARPANRTPSTKRPPLSGHAPPAGPGGSCPPRRGRSASAGAHAGRAGAPAPAAELALPAHEARQRRREGRPTGRRRLRLGRHLGGRRQRRPRPGGPSIRRRARGASPAGQVRVTR